MNSGSRWGDNYGVANETDQRGNNFSVGCASTHSLPHTHTHTHACHTHMQIHSEHLHWFGVSLLFSHTWSSIALMLMRPTLYAHTHRQIGYSHTQTHKVVFAAALYSSQCLQSSTKNSIKEIYFIYVHHFWFCSVT